MLTLASLAKGNTLFGIPIAGFGGPTNAGCVPLIHMAYWVSNIATSDWYIESAIPGPGDGSDMDSSSVSMGSSTVSVKL